MCVCVCVCVCVYVYVYIYIYIYIYTYTHTILAKVLCHPLLMKGLTTLVISMSTNLNFLAYNNILGNCVLIIL